MRFNKSVLVFLLCISGYVDAAIPKELKQTCPAIINDLKIHKNATQVLIYNRCNKEIHCSSNSDNVPTKIKHSNHPKQLYLLDAELQLSFTRYNPKDEQNITVKAEPNKITVLVLEEKKSLVSLILELFKPIPHFFVIKKYMIDLSELQ